MSAQPPSTSRRPPAKPSSFLAIVFVVATGLAACEQMAARSDTPTATVSTADDAQITSAVKARLAQERVSALAQIDVHTRGGVVELSGAVDSTAVKDRAGELAREVSGVHQVANNLRVRPFGS
jgi:hyperosmotically inducible periplasmic protein